MVFLHGYIFKLRLQPVFVGTLDPVWNWPESDSTPPEKPDLDYREDTCECTVFMGMFLKGTFEGKLLNLQFTYSTQLPHLCALFSHLILHSVTPFTTSPRSSLPILYYYIKWVNTYWTYSTPWKYFLSLCGFGDFNVRIEISYLSVCHCSDLAILQLNKPAQTSSTRESLLSISKLIDTTSTVHVHVYLMLLYLNMQGINVSNAFSNLISWIYNS